MDCPGAPKKKCRRLVIVPCMKRLQFEVEVIQVGSEEIDRLFRQRRLVPSVGRRRKRCCVDGNE
ncbi:hypothetical protein ZOSMA_253G00090 [Zostera marina]|uniref:Uncharacterized protein n=1 Tax=Zostera marina TaxID=29655 RepID=A0A0K9PFY4_ZOSMR|nr:hypothetical protein ZOSMA_253G00090 [Zostera marina]